MHSQDSLNFWVCAPFFTLEFVTAVEKWMEELAADPNMKQWFVDGVNRLEQGLLLGGSSARGRV